MKSLIVFLVLACSSLSASTIIINSENSDYELAKVPQNLLATFVDQGFKQVEVTPKVWDLTIDGLRCDSLSRDNLYPDFSNAGLPSIKCYVNAVPEMNGIGIPVQESRFIQSLINIIEAKAYGDYSDCSMGGKCSSFIASIICTLDLNQDEMHKAYSCTIKSLTDLK
jgi:hypothetical protein